jgi:hypothetical protein
VVVGSVDVISGLVRFLALFLTCECWLESYSSPPLRIVIHFELGESRVVESSGEAVWMMVRGTMVVIVVYFTSR